LACAAGGYRYDPSRESAGGRLTARRGEAVCRVHAWIAADVQKESVAELETSGLTWDQVDKAVQTAARSWFLKVSV
jgi:hypothetical protein